MARNVARHFAAAGRVADMYGVAQIQMLGDRSRVSGVVIDVVPFRSLARASVAAAIDADDPVAVLEEKQHLAIPVVRAEGPAVVEDDRLALAPVLVEDLNAIFRGDRAHGFGSFATVGRSGCCADLARCDNRRQGCCNGDAQAADQEPAAGLPNGAELIGVCHASSPGSEFSGQLRETVTSAPVRQFL